MPILLGIPIEVLIFAAIAIALVIGALLASGLLNNLFSSIPLVGGFIASTLANWTSTIAQWLFNASSSTWHWVGDFITDHAWVLGALGDWATQAITNVNSKANYISGTQLPDAINAEANARIAQIQYATYVFQGEINTLQNDLTWDAAVLNNQISAIYSTAIPEAINDAYNYSLTVINQTAANLQANINTVDTQLSQALPLIWSAIDGLQTAVNTTIPEQIANEATLENQAISSASAAQASALQQATQTLQSQLDQTNAQIASEVATATAPLQGDLNDLQSSLAAQQAALAAAVATLSSVAPGAAQAELEAAAAQAAVVTATQAINALNAAIASVESQIDQVASQTATQLQAEAQSLQQQITANQQAISQMTATTTIETPAVGTQIGVQSITIPLAVTGLATEVATIATEIDDCMVSTCGGPNNWENLLQNLFAAAELASLIPFLTALATDPSGEAAAVASIAEDLYGAGHSLIDGLLAL